MDLSEYLKMGLKDLCKSKQTNRIEQIRQLRQSSRDKCTMSQRNIDQSSVKMMELPKVKARMQAMLAWKAEKKLREEQNNKKLKPIFKVSKVVATTKLEDLYKTKVNNSHKILAESAYKFKAPNNIKPINLNQRFTKYNSSSKTDFNDFANRKAATKRNAVDEVGNIKGKTNSNNLDKFNVIEVARKISNAFKSKVNQIKEESSPKETKIHDRIIKSIKSPSDMNLMDTSESPKSMPNANVLNENLIPKTAITKVQTPKKLFRKRLYGTNRYIKKSEIRNANL